MLQIGPERILQATAGPSGPTNAFEGRPEHGPWSGDQVAAATIPLPLATIYRAENAFTSLDEAHERSAFASSPWNSSRSGPSDWSSTNC